MLTMAWFGLALLCGLLSLVAVLYASVGQAGASGFVAVMALFGFSPEVVKPTALVLNVLVSSVVALRFARDVHFSWPVLRPFLIASIPAAGLGGYLTLPAVVFNPVLGALLLVASVPFFVRRASTSIPTRLPPVIPALVAGATIGLLSGLTGTGGGILLAPLLLHCRWASLPTTVAVSGVFIFVNSALALAGHLVLVARLPPDLPWLAVAVVLGGALGAQLGSRHLPLSAVHRILGLTIGMAGLKLLVA